MESFHGSLLDSRLKWIHKSYLLWLLGSYQEPLGEPSPGRFLGRIREWIRVWMLARRTESRLRSCPESEFRSRRQI